MKQQTTNNKQQTTITNTMNWRKTLIIIFVIGIFSSNSISQNITITDDDGYTAETSAMLDVKSLTKGMLIPRIALISINNPVSGTKPEGLLVWNTSTTGTYSIPGFYYWNGSAWVNLLAKSDYSGGIDAALFSVVNASGDTIFAVYPEGVRIWVDDSPSKATGSKGGFAVGGLNAGKGYTNEYFRITPDSIRMYIDTAQSTKATGSKGGFAVGGLNAGKTNGLELLRVTDDSVRIYVKNTPSKATGSKGGFAVGGFNAGKLEPVDFMNLTPDNYFIGHESGENINGGRYNSVLGYQAGKALTTGNSNVFIGHHAGLANTEGYNNIFIGQYAGDANITGDANTFIGVYAGSDNLIGSENTFIGLSAGGNNTDGEDNTFTGSRCGISNESGNHNTFYGKSSGFINSTASNNTFIGSGSGYLSNGNFNTFIGNGSGWGNTSGILNTSIGYQAGNSSETGSYNTYLGGVSARNNNSGNNNTMVGYGAGYSGSGSSNVFLGFNAGYNETNSNKLYIENSNGDETEALIYGEFDNDILVFNAKVGIGTTSPIGKLDVQGDEVRIWDGTATINYATDAGDLYVEDVLEVDNEIYVTDYIAASGGIHVGGTSDPGTDNLIVDGNVGIATTSPIGKLDVRGDEVRIWDGAATINYATGAGDLYVEDVLEVDDDIYVVDNVIVTNYVAASGGIHVGGTSDPGTDNLIVDGKVGIGTTTPIADIHIVGSSTLGSLLIAPDEGVNGDDSEIQLAEDNDYTYGMSIKFDGGDNNLYVYGKSSTTNYGPHLSIGRNTGLIKMPNVYDDIVGTTRRDLYIDNTGKLGYVSSSIRYKKNIIDMENINWLYELRPVNFVYKNDTLSVKQYGLIAEEVEKINKSFISYNKDGKVETVSYDKLVTPLLKAIQEQKKQIEILKSENKNLKNEVNKIEQLQKQINKLNELMNVKASK